MKKELIALLLPLFLALPLRSTLLAQQDMSSQERTQELQDKEKALIQKIEKKKEIPQIKEEQPVEPQLPESREQIFIQNINVTGVSLIPEKKIKDIVAPFENKKLTLRELQKAADLITDFYRQKGYITSRAYLPPQKIQNSILEIKVIEGKMGDVEVKGNRYFKTKLLLSKITLRRNEPFNYNLLRRDLTKINQSPDRASRVVLVPGKEPGETDVILEVKDHLPIHLGFDWDTYGSRYIGKDRYSVRFTDNNLLGFDDSLAFQYQLAQRGSYYLKNIRYLLPLKAGWQIGASLAFSRVKLGKEFEDSDVRGNSKVYALFATKSLIDQENFDLNLNLGFDYKNITNYQLQTVSSEDRLRIAKVGLDMDMTDNFGRTLLTDEFAYGIPDIMGGLKKPSATSTASRSGSGGKFVKNTINLLRLQKLPFSSTLLWKNQLQFSPYILTAAEQFQIGGIANVRGYPPAEVVGDQGYSMTGEWTFPPYFFPKNIRVPFSRAKVYDAFRFAMFYDWANARLSRPTAGIEEKNKTLRSAGCGVRFNLPEDFNFRLDLGWPLDNTPSDSDHLHTWVSLSKNF